MIVNNRYISCLKCQVYGCCTDRMDLTYKQKIAIMLKIMVDALKAYDKIHNSYDEIFGVQITKIQETG